MQRCSPVSKYNLRKKVHFHNIKSDTKKQAIKSVKVLIFLRLLELLPSS